MTVKSHERDGRMMARALCLARRGEGRTRPNPPVGAVVARGDRIAGEGYHRRAGSPHAEVHALRATGDLARGACLYVTLEPCCTEGRTPPCTDLIIRSGISRVVVAVRDPNPRHAGRGIRLLRKAGVDVLEGIGRKDGEELIAPFAKWITTGRPFLTLKMAMTLDGRIADSRGASKWITGTGARRVVQSLRARSDVVMVGASTVCADNPSLLARKGRGAVGLRLVVDSVGRLPMASGILRDGQAHRTIVATTEQCPLERREAFRATGATVWVVRQAGKRVSLRSLMRRLGREGVLRIACEGGGELAASLVRQDLVDEYVFFVAPRFLGAGGTPVLGELGVKLKGAPSLAFRSCERVGKDLMVVAFPAGR